MKPNYVLCSYKGTLVSVGCHDVISIWGEDHEIFTIARVDLESGKYQWETVSPSDVRIFREFNFEEDTPRLSRMLREFLIKEMM